MRRALIACIHGNLVALEAVLKDIAAEGVDEIVCLGDIIGYGPDVVECVDLVREKCAWSLCGDFDARLFIEPPTGMNRNAYRATQIELQKLKPTWHSGPDARARWKWLENLDARKSNHEALFVHASPRDPLMEYVLEADFQSGVNVQGPKSRKLFNFSESICFCSHTGIPGIVARNGKWRRPEELEDGCALVGWSEKTIVNVGSVGMPRDGDPRSSYLLWDDDLHEVTFHRVPYDIDAIRARYEAMPGYGERVWQRLKQGR